MGSWAHGNVDGRVLLVASPTRANERSARFTNPSGGIDIVLGPPYVQQMFRAGVFVYGSSDVELGLGDDLSMRVYFPLKGTSKAAPTSLIQVDGETGGMDFYNGPNGTTASLHAPVVRRTGSTGFTTGTVIGPFSTETGQFEKTKPVFAMSSARAKPSSTGGRWTQPSLSRIRVRQRSTPCWKRTSFKPAQASGRSGQMSGLAEELSLGAHISDRWPIEGTIDLIDGEPALA